MKRVMVLMIVAAAVSAGFAQYRAVDRQAGMMIEGRPFFTDAARYNSYDLAGSPLGLFDINSSEKMSVDLGYRYYGLGDETGHYLSGQTIRMGQPGRSFFELFYGPDIMSDKNSRYNNNKISLPLHRFGLTLATQDAEGSFRTSIMAAGYAGGQEWERGDSSRALMGVEKLRLDMGGRVHPFLRIGFFINFSGHLDTLYVPGVTDDMRRDCPAQLNLPEFGGNIDFGDDDMPVRSNLSVSYALSRFVYTSKWPTGFPPADQWGNVPPIMGDSLRVAWLTQGEIPVLGDGYVASPGLLLGYFGTSGTLHDPHPESNPLQPGPARPNTDYSLSGFHFGVGAGFKADKYAALHFEYSAAFMSLECGSAYPAPEVKSRNLHNVSFGASANLHDYLELPLEITPRIAYFISGSARGAGTAHSDLWPMNAAPGRSKQGLYMPNTYLTGFTRTNGFTFGIDGLALEEMLSASFWMTFLSHSIIDKGGMELGLSFGIRM